ncbi:MAG: hypothetical protein HQK55_09430, partial [Deltaproteobacteria bacterium]|nr:hypothetical protein [Deltaproteobacteria bacterium]
PAARRIKQGIHPAPAESGELCWERVENSPGPGNVLFLEMESELVTEIVTGFGQKGRLAENVADQAANEAREYLEADVPVGGHLADQLLIYLALAGGGSYLTMRPTLHTLTNIEVIRQFLDVDFMVKPYREKAWIIGL